MNRLVDLIFLMDMCLQFVLMYPTSGATLEGAKWEDDPVAIRQAYLKSWFSIDLIANAVSAFDFYAVANSDDSSSVDAGTTGGDMRNDFSKNISKFKMIRFVRLFRLVKLARLLRASRILKRCAPPPPPLQPRSPPPPPL